MLPSVVVFPVTMTPLRAGGRGAALAFHLPAMGLPAAGPNAKVVSVPGVVFAGCRTNPPAALNEPTVVLPSPSQSPTTATPVPMFQAKFRSLKVIPLG